VVEAQEVDRAGDLARRPQSGERIGGGAEADIPQDELAGVMLEALDQAQLTDIQRLGLGHRADDRMERLVMGQRMDAVRPIGEPNDSVSGGGLHGTNFQHPAAEAKLKARERPLGQAYIKLVETARTWQRGRPAAECQPSLSHFAKWSKPGKAALHPSAVSLGYIMRLMRNSA